MFTDVPRIELLLLSYRFDTDYDTQHQS